MSSLLASRIPQLSYSLCVFIECILLGSHRITNPCSSVSAWVIPTGEDPMIARHTCQPIKDDSHVSCTIGQP